MNYAEQLLNRLKVSTYVIQRKSIDLTTLPGKFIERDSKIFRVISINETIIVLSDVKTPINQTTKMTVKSFLSKCIQEIVNQ